MTMPERSVLIIVSRLLEYPDKKFFAAIPDFRAEASEALQDAENADALAVILNFLDNLENEGEEEAQEKYVATFDHTADASLYMTWHRYGNDRSQGRAMAALNGLYRTAGYEPLPSIMPDYLPRMLEFLAVCDDWAAEIMLDGFGPELNQLEKGLHQIQCAQAPLLSLALEPLRRKWPNHFLPRTKPDPTRRPMARPDPELTPLEPLNHGIR